MPCNNPNCPKCRGGNMNQKDKIVTIGDTGIIYEKTFSGDVKVGKIDSLIEKELKELQVDNDELDKKLDKSINMLYDIYDKSKGEYGLPRPQTAEQKIKQQAEFNKDLLFAVKELRAEIQTLKKGDVIKI